MSGYRFHVTCPRCGGALKHVASGTSNGTETQAVVRCTKHGCTQPDWVITVIARSVTRLRHADNEIAGRHAWCGSPGGVTKHAELGEEPCADCLAANARKEKARRDRHRQKEPA